MRPILLTVRFKVGVWISPSYKIRHRLDRMKPLLFLPLMFVTAEQRSSKFVDQVVVMREVSLRHHVLQDQIWTAVKFSIS